MGPTLVAYLHGARVGASGTVEVTIAEAVACMSGALWLAALAVVGAATLVVVVVAVGVAMSVGVVAAAGAEGVGSGLGLDPPGGAEEWRTQGLKLCPLRVFTMFSTVRDFAGCEISQTWKFLHCSNLNLPSATPAK